MTVIKKFRFGFKSEKQLPLFMIWKEWSVGETVYYAEVLFNSRRWIGV